MIRYAAILVALSCSAACLRADLIMEQQISDATTTRLSTLNVHSNTVRLDMPGGNLAVIIDLDTRNSLTLFTTNKTYMKMFGKEILWQIQEEKKLTHGTNDMDAAPAPAVDTGKSELVNGRPTELFAWRGAHGLAETLWVDTNFPNFTAIKADLAKLDRFNETGLHRNAQPVASLLPGVAVKSITDFGGHSSTNTLVSLKSEPLDAALFELPQGYTLWQRPTNKAP
jgi:hypothetical protein